MNTSKQSHLKLVKPHVCCKNWKITYHTVRTLIYKSFVRPHLDCSDAIFDQACNNSFQQRLESLQQKASSVITGAIKGSSTEKLYLELGLESLQNRRWFRKLCVSFKIVKEASWHFFQTAIHTKEETVRSWWFPSLKILFFHQH